MTDRITASLAEFAAIPGVPSQVTLRQLIKDNPDFPAKPGTNGVAYEIDVASAIAWVKARDEKRIAAEGRIYTSEAVALRTKDRTCEKKDLEFDVGFVVQIAGADGLVPRNGLVRLGGDGRGARIDACEMLLPEPDWDRIAKERRFRLVLSTPGLFEQGWRLPGIQPDGVTWQGPNGASARLLCAEVSRAQVVSGWDLAQRVPKAALRAAPAGSVYWFESFEGDISALRKLAEDGFGCLSSYPDRARHAEGFNNALVANWAAGGA